MTPDADPMTTTLVLARTFPAPREAVFRAWTEPAALARWWWPARFATTYDIDLRAGGGYRFRTAELPELGVLGVSGTFLEVRAPERIVYTWAWEGSEDAETRVTVEFRDHGHHTQVVLRHERFATEQERDDHAQGWSDCLDRLAGALAAQTVPVPAAAG